MGDFILQPLNLDNKNDVLNNSRLNNIDKTNYLKPYFTIDNYQFVKHNDVNTLITTIPTKLYQNITTDDSNDLQNK